MRLIDADVEIARIEKEIQRIDEKIERIKNLLAEESSSTLHNFEKELEQCHKNKTDCKLEIASIKNYQTAYDVDKVVERLEKRKEYLTNEFVIADISRQSKEKTLERINEIAGMIEIVKSGGDIG